MILDSNLIFCEGLALSTAGASDVLDLTEGGDALGNELLIVCQCSEKAAGGTSFVVDIETDDDSAYRDGRRFRIFRREDAFQLRRYSHGGRRDRCEAVRGARAARTGALYERECDGFRHFHGREAGYFPRRRRYAQLGGYLGADGRGGFSPPF